MRKGRTRVDPDDPTAFKVDPSRYLIRIMGEEEATRVVNLPGASHNLPMVMNAEASKELRKALKAGMPHMIHRECEEMVGEIGKISGGAERIISTPIPLSYTRHTSRSLMIWLLTLPFALWETFHWATVPAVFALTYLTIGLDEIGIQIEEPFSVLPVKPLADVCERDVRALDQLLELGGFPESRK
jgi:predicted membrane chloride channel (bestrophin family)